ncbi:unnamed protein product [Prorocentrum cordatum]|uniref:Uncharacterized protein n=1 Tax=Prorocentrum cordatum TaxID=2364126 RepID=A0ABN9QDQ9_9DINO|nr:unnamed protein product [Polarella glacialis]
MASAFAIALLLAAGAEGARPALDLEGAGLRVEDSGGDGASRSWEKRGCADVVPGAEAFHFGSCRCAAAGARLAGGDAACKLEEEEDVFLPDSVQGKGCFCRGTLAGSSAGEGGFLEMADGEPRCPILAEVSSLEECSEATAALALDGGGPFLNHHLLSTSFCYLRDKGNDAATSFWNPEPPTYMQGNPVPGSRPVCRGTSYYLQDRAAERGMCPEGHELLSGEECRAALALMTGQRVSRYRLEPAHAWGCRLEATEVPIGRALVTVTEAVFLYRPEGSQSLTVNPHFFTLKGSVCRTSNSTAIAEQAIGILKKPWSSVDLIINAIRQLSASGRKGADRSEALVPYLWHEDITKGSAKKVTSDATQYARACVAVGMVPAWERHKGLKGKILSLDIENGTAELAGGVDSVHVPIRALHGLGTWQPRRVSAAAVGALGVFFGYDLVDASEIGNTIAKVLKKHLREISSHEEWLKNLGSSSPDMAVRDGARELGLLGSAWKRESLNRKAILRDTARHLVKDVRTRKAFEKAQQEKKKVSQERNISQSLSRQVGMHIVFDSAHTLKMPRGTMLLWTSLNEVEAHRCPRVPACPGVDLKLEDLEGLNHSLGNGPCAQGYSPNAPGCAGCASPESGRSPIDVFTCGACGDYTTEVLRHISVPLALYLFGMKSAYDPSEAECFGSVTTVFLSFHSTASLVLSSIEASPIGIEHNVSALLGSLTVGAESASGMPSGSIDCLVKRPAGITSWLLHSAAVPVTIFLLWVVGAVALGYIRGERPNYIVIIVRPMAVFVKSFFPMIFAGVWRAWPCFHTQGAPSRALMIYNVNETCPVLFSRHPDPGLVLCLCGALLCCVLGPGLWLHISGGARRCLLVLLVLALLISAGVPRTACTAWPPGVSTVGSVTRGMAPHMSDATNRGRLRRHWRVSCPRRVARESPRLQCGVPRDKVAA